MVPGYGAEGRDLMLGFAIRWLVFSVNQAVNGYSFRIRESWNPPFIFVPKIQWDSSPSPTAMGNLNFLQ